MTNSIIPYSFIPGTKAKANEINANFISLATSIDNSREYTKDEITSLDTKLTKEISDSKTSLAAKDLTDTNYFSNCILEAPNGVADFEVTTITVKEGLKVSLPDGRNENSTLKSTILTLDADLTYTPSIENDTKLLFLKSDKTLIACNKKSIYFTKAQPITIYTYSLWFNYSENQWYETNNTGNTWTKIWVVHISDYTTNETAITSIEPQKAVGFLKSTDKMEIVRWLIPDYNAGIIFSTTNARIPFPGWIITPDWWNAGGQVTVNGKIIDYAYTEGGNFAVRPHIQIMVDTGDLITNAGNLMLYPMKGVTNA